MDILDFSGKTSAHTQKKSTGLKFIFNAYSFRCYWEETSLAQPDSGTNTMVSIPALLRRNANSFGNSAAFREKEFGIWQTWTWSKALDEAESFGLGLIELGIETGDFVAIIGRNRPDLYISMIAIQMAGGIPVPLYQDAVAEEMEYVLAHCGAKFVVAGDQEQVDKVLEIQSKLPDFEQMIYLDGRGRAHLDKSFAQNLGVLTEFLKLCLLAPDHQRRRIWRHSGRAHIPSLQQRHLGIKGPVYLLPFVWRSYLYKGLGGCGLLLQRNRLFLFPVQLSQDQNFQLHQVL